MDRPAYNHFIDTHVNQTDNLFIYRVQTSKRIFIVARLGAVAEINHAMTCKNAAG